VRRLSFVEGAGAAHESVRQDPAGGHAQGEALAGWEPGALRPPWINGLQFRCGSNETDLCNPTPVIPGSSLARFSHTVRSEAQREADRFKARAGPSPQVR
jgi:hypothetical protein